jgi:4-amino-4-deoxy-L-arabinose transferase-like glycosyltransferase
MGSRLVMRQRHKSREKFRQEPAGWLVRHRLAVLGLLIAVSVVTRVVFFVQLNATPFIQMHQWRQTDMHYYDGWARQIASGDWLSSSVRLPMHRWHREVAARYFTEHPDAKRNLEQEAARSGPAMDAEEMLWSHWMRLPQFYQDPLYPYLIAATYKIARIDVRAVMAWQLALGVLTNVLIWVLARRFFDDTVAACAGALAVLCAPLMFYELVLLRDSAIACTGLTLIWLLDRVLRRTGGGWALPMLLGFALGAACLLKSTFVPLAAAIMGVLLMQGRRVAMVCLGLLMALGPVAVRNLEVGVSPVALASSGPLTFVASNDVRARPEVGFGIDAARLTEFLGNTNGGWRAALAEGLESHTLGSYTGLLWRKWDRLWHWYEIPNNENFYYMRMRAPVLLWLPVTFWLCSPLALVGLVIGLKRWQESWPLYALVVVSAAPLIIFYVLGRFRIALFAAVLPFAALTVVEIVRSMRRHRYARGFSMVAAVLLIGAWTSRALAEDQLLIRTADWILPWSITYESQVYGALDAKNPGRAAAAYLEFFKYEPTDAQILTSRDPQLPAELADMHNECAQILRIAGESALAEAQVQRAQHILGLRTVR